MNLMEKVNTDEENDDLEIQTYSKRNVRIPC